MATTVVEIGSAWTRVALAADLDFLVTPGTGVDSLEGVFTNSDATPDQEEGHLVGKSVMGGFVRAHGSGDLHVRIRKGRDFGNVVVSK